MAQTQQPNPREAGTRIEQLLEELRASTDPAVPPRVQHLVQLLVEVYGAALGRIVEVLQAEEEAGRGLLDRLVADDLVASLLVLHDLHPADTETRVRQALDQVR